MLLAIDPSLLWVARDDPECERLLLEVWDNFSKYRLALDRDGLEDQYRDIHFNFRCYHSTKTSLAFLVLDRIFTEEAIRTKPFEPDPPLDLQGKIVELECRSVIDRQLVVVAAHAKAEESEAEASEGEPRKSLKLLLGPLNTTTYMPSQRKLRDPRFVAQLCASFDWIEVDYPRVATPRDPRPPDKTSQAKVSERKITIDSQALFAAMCEAFSLEELRTLLFLHFDIDHERILGETVQDKVRETILYCKRHGLFDKLVEVVQVERPHLFSRENLPLHLV